jgi:hypothetical protein
MAKKSVPPSQNEVAFDCPHCGAYTTQTWYDVVAKRLSEKSRVPLAINRDVVEALAKNENLTLERRQEVAAYLTKILDGSVVLNESRNEALHGRRNVGNLNLSECFVCNKIAVWVSGAVIFPPTFRGPEPNADLPEDVLRDYNEASTILTLSPRGAAALLRLAIQKLCAELGEKGQRIDDDIASLVKKGLSQLVQQALDAVRVIGNESVHPGTLDLKDDTDTATKLFRLVNIIAEQMISNPKHVQELYAKLPQSKLDGIANRGAPK